jgi:DNA polymerase-3 subunit gamma/tau
VVHVARDLLRHLRNLVVAKACDATPERAGHALARGANVPGPSLREMLDLADEEVRDVLALASSADADDLSRCFQGFSSAFDDIARSDQPRMALEMALVRMARRPPLLPLDELLARVGDLERRLGGAPPPGPVPRGGGGGGGRGVSLPSTPVATEVASTRTHGALALAEAPRARPAVVSLPSPRLDQPAARAVDLPSPGFDHDAAQVTDVASIATARATPEPETDAWRAILERVRAARPAIASVLEHAIPLEVGASQVIIGFEASDGFLSARAGEREAIDVLTRETRAHFGAPTHVAIDASGRRAAGGVRTVASVDAERRSAEVVRARAAVQAHPVVEEAMRLFGARLQDVKLPSGDG